MQLQNDADILRNGVRPENFCEGDLADVGTGVPEARFLHLRAKGEAIINWDRFAHYLSVRIKFTASQNAITGLLFILPRAPRRLSL